MNILSILSKRAQSGLQGTPITVLLSEGLLNHSEHLTAGDKVKLSIIKESYKDYALETISKDKPCITSTRAAGELFLKLLTNETQEKVMVALLNTKNEVIAVDTIFTGTLNASLFHPREIFSFALKHPTARILIAHNHPSGDTEPSRADIDSTIKLIAAGETLGIEVLDHIIVGNGYRSLRETSYAFDN